MAALPAQHDPDPDAAARVERDQLEQMVHTLCEHVERLVGAARERGELQSREAGLQVQAFEERYEQAVQVLTAPEDGEPHEIRIGRLQKVVEALDCSRAFFRGELNTI